MKFFINYLAKRRKEKIRKQRLHELEETFATLQRDKLRSMNHKLAKDLEVTHKQVKEAQEWLEERLHAFSKKPIN